MDEIFSKFDGGSTAATAIRAGGDGQTIGNVVLTVVSAQKRLFFTLGSSGLFFQDADPGAVGTNAIWVNFANMRVGIRNGSNTAWDFYTADGGVGLIGSSGYGIGEYGNVPWDEQVVNSSVLTTTPSLGLYKPMYATVGWGTWINADMDKAEALNVRILALEAQVP